ncbi:MAG: AAA domain-containing protein [bacterium]
MDRSEDFGDYDEGPSGRSPDLASLGTAVTTFFGDQAREPLSPDRLSALHAGARPPTGIYNHAVLMAAGRTRYAKSLLEDLARIRNASDEDLDRTALAEVFRVRDGQSQDAKSSVAPDERSHGALVGDTCPLNGEQREAVGAILAQDTTLVTGPPGTGKSQVVASAVANARLHGQSVLFASRNHKAIDAVVSRPEMITQDGLPLVVRANDRESGISFGFADAIKELLSAPHDEAASARAEELRTRLMTDLEGRASQELIAKEIDSLREQIAKIETVLSQLAADWPEERLDELDRAPERFPSDIALRLFSMTRRLAGHPQPVGGFSRLRLRLQARSVRRLARKVERAVRKFSVAWGSDRRKLGNEELDVLAERADSLRIAAEYAKERIRLRPLEQRASELPSAGDVANRVQALTEQIVARICEAIEQDSLRRVGLGKEADRAGLASLQVGLRKLYDPLSTDEIRTQSWAALESHLPDLLFHYPAWAVTNLSVGSRIALMPGIFDLAIIDEASQCDIPSAIPILFRARRAAVVGDPFQLSHTTKLTRARENVICKRRGITSLWEQRFSYRDTSLFDLFAQTNSVKPVLLRDHFRCATEIAEYANSTFYGSRLRVVTAANRLNVPAGTRPGIHWTPIVSPLTPARTGCTASAEIDEIVRLLRLLVVDQGFGGTVGVVTPFQAQKQQLSDKIFSDPEIAEAADRLRLIVDTAHGFQGDERDVMYMSLCAGPGMPAKSLGWLRNTGNLLNVATTRARAVLHMVGNREWAMRCGIRHIAQLAQRPSSARAQVTSGGRKFESIWEERLYDALKAEGLNPIPQHPILGRRLDLALMKEGRVPIDIEVDGARFHREPDGSRRRDDIWRDITIRGAGWKVMRFWVYELREDMKGCVSRIAREWNDVI